MKVSTIAYLGLSTLLLGLMPTPAMGVTIDLFSDVDDAGGEQFVQDNTLSDGGTIDTDGAGTSLTDVIGGTRTIFVEKLSNASGTKIVTSTIDTNASPNLFSYSSPSSTTGSFSITWDGDFGSGIDLTDDNGTEQRSFELNIITNDQNNVQLKFEVSDGTNTSVWRKTFPTQQTGTLLVPFDQFSSPSVLESAQSITFSSTNAPANLDFELAFAATSEDVPFEFSPGVGIIIAGSFFGLNTLRKKLKASN